jgi:hypothetical protein
MDEGVSVERWDEKGKRSEETEGWCCHTTHQHAIETYTGHICDLLMQMRHFVISSSWNYRALLFVYLYVYSMIVPRYEKRYRLMEGHYHTMIPCAIRKFVHIVVWVSLSWGSWRPLIMMW